MCLLRVLLDLMETGLCVSDVVCHLFGVCFFGMIMKLYKEPIGNRTHLL